MPTYLNPVVNNSNYDHFFQRNLFQLFIPLKMLGDEKIFANNSYWGHRKRSKKHADRFVNRSICISHRLRCTTRGNGFKEKSSFRFTNWTEIFSFSIRKKRPLSTKRLDPSEIPRIVDQEGKHQIKIQKKRREIGEWEWTQKIRQHIRTARRSRR